jgi:uridine kinase
MDRRPYLIGIAGPSWSGKTRLAEALQALLPGTSVVLSLDCYYLDLAHLPLNERAVCNFDEPDALDRALLRAHIGRLAQGETIERPVYLFAEHTRAKVCERVAAADFVLIEGLFTLYWSEIRNLLDTRVFVQVPDELALFRRLDRDVRERGRSPLSVEQQYASTVRPMCERHLLPTLSHADVVVNGQCRIEVSSGLVMEHVRQQWEAREKRKLTSAKP